jgi:hypothetical protein
MRRFPKDRKIEGPEKGEGDLLYLDDERVKREHIELDARVPTLMRKLCSYMSCASFAYGLFFGYFSLFKCMAVCFSACGLHLGTHVFLLFFFVS